MPMLQLFNAGSQVLDDQRKRAGVGSDRDKRLLDSAGTIEFFLFGTRLFETKT
jgi:hypothetical protein